MLQLPCHVEFHESFVQMSFLRAAGMAIVRTSSLCCSKAVLRQTSVLVVVGENKSNAHYVFTGATQVLTSSTAFKTNLGVIISFKALIGLISS